MAHKLKLSKRYGLVKLDIDWREKIFNSVRSERLKLAVSVLAATGCRPIELERGIIIRANEDKLSIGIPGAKVDEKTGRGQPMRLLIVDCKSLWGNFLLQYARAQVNYTAVIKYDAGGVSQRLREKSRAIWPRRSTLISAYTYRHYLGKSMKESGESTDKIASTLGHAADFSQTAYGRAGGKKKSAGSHGIFFALATNQIRHSKKSDKLLRFTNPVKTDLKDVL